MRVSVAPLFFLALLFSQRGFATAPVPPKPTPQARKNQYILKRDCRVFTDATLNSPILCTASSGSTVTLQFRTPTSFVKAITPHCPGYLAPICFGVERENASLLDGNLYDNGLKVGFLTSIGITSGRVGYSATSSNGMGYSLGMMARLPIFREFHVSLATSYEKIKLVRSINGSGSILDFPSEFSQTISYFSAKLNGGYHLPFGGLSSGIQFWADTGIEFLLPISASQSSNGNDTSFTPTDKPLFFVIGPSLIYPYGPLRAYGGLEVFYNVAAASSARLVGIRIALALLISL